MTGKLRVEPRAVPPAIIVLFQARRALVFTDVRFRGICFPPARNFQIGGRNFHPR
jgi:hypothetical protein